VKYTVNKDCDWKDWGAQAAPPGSTEPVVIGPADLKTGDGEPLPAEVVAELVRRKALAPVEPAKANPAAETVRGKAKRATTPPDPTTGPRPVPPSNHGEPTFTDAPTPEG
jgi:hypothetical protein